MADLQLGLKLVGFLAARGVPNFEVVVDSSVHTAHGGDHAHKTIAAGTARTDEPGGGFMMVGGTMNGLTPEVSRGI
jgi:hypothetical protein